MIIDIKKTSELSSLELLEIIKARLEVFAVEQNIVYNDIDDKDLICTHIIIKDSKTSDIIAYSRVYLEDTYVSFGRFLVVSKYRDKGYAKKLIKEVINFCKVNYNNLEIIINAQVQVSKFYKDNGFEYLGSSFILEDIEHIKMSKKSE